MTDDFERQQAKYWFDDACRKSYLIGGITACIEATRADVSNSRTTPAKAIKRIAELLAEFDAETEKLRGGDQ